MEITEFQGRDQEVWRPPSLFAPVAKYPNCTISILGSFFFTIWESQIRLSLECQIQTKPAHIVVNTFYLRQPKYCISVVNSLFVQCLKFVGKWKKKLTLSFLSLYLFFQMFVLFSSSIRLCLSFISWVDTLTLNNTHTQMYCMRNVITINSNDIHLFDWFEWLTILMIDNDDDGNRRCRLTNHDASNLKT